MKLSRLAYGATLLLVLFSMACGEPCQEQACEANGSCQEYHQLLCSCCSSADQVAACETAVGSGCQDGSLRVCMDETGCASEVDNWNNAYAEGVEPCAYADVSEVTAYCEQATSQ